jgi:hypothetical protein
VTNYVFGIMLCVNENFFLSRAFFLVMRKLQEVMGRLNEKYREGNSICEECLKFRGGNLSLLE